MKKSIREYLHLIESLGRSPKTIIGYHQRLGYFCEHCKRRRVRSIRRVTIELVRSWHDVLIGRGVSDHTRWAYMSTLRHFFRWCYSNGRILTDVADRMEVPKPGETLPPTALTLDEMEKIFTAIQTGTVTGKRCRAVLEVLYGCGLRKDEILKLNVGDVDAVSGTLFVHGKGSRDRIVPINETALESIADYLKERCGKPRKASPLFLLHGPREKQQRRMDGNALSLMISRLAKMSSVHLHAHLFRHTYAVHLLRGGADIRYVQALLGHESPDTTSRYLGLVKAELKAEYDRALESLFGV